MPAASSSRGRPSASARDERQSVGQLRTMASTAGSTSTVERRERRRVDERVQRVEQLAARCDEAREVERTAARRARRRRSRAGAPGSRRWCRRRSRPPAGRGCTGSVVARPASGSRTTALAKLEAAAFGRAGPHDHRRRPRRARVEEALARRVGEQQLEHRLGRAVGRRRRLARAVVDRPERELAAEHGQRAREHEARRACRARGRPATSARPPSRLTSSAASKSRSAPPLTIEARWTTATSGLSSASRSSAASRMSPRSTRDVGEVVGRREPPPACRAGRSSSCGRASLRRRRASSMPSMPRPPVITMRIAL